MTNRDTATCDCPHCWMMRDLNAEKARLEAEKERLEGIIARRKRFDDMGLSFVWRIVVLMGYLARFAWLYTQIAWTYVGWGGQLLRNAVLDAWWWFRGRIARRLN